MVCDSLDEWVASDRYQLLAFGVLFGRGWRKRGRERTEEDLHSVVNQQLRHWFFVPQSSEPVPYRFLGNRQLSCRQPLGGLRGRDRGEGLISLAHTLGITAVAEGAQTSK